MSEGDSEARFRKMRDISSEGSEAKMLESGTAMLMVSDRVAILPGSQIQIGASPYDKEQQTVWVRCANMSSHHRFGSPGLTPSSLRSRRTSLTSA